MAGLKVKELSRCLKGLAELALVCDWYRCDLKRSAELGLLEHETSESYLASTMSFGYMYSGTSGITRFYETSDFFKYLFMMSPAVPVVERSSRVGDGNFGPFAGENRMSLRR